MEGYTNEGILSGILSSINLGQNLSMSGSGLIGNYIPSKTGWDIRKALTHLTSAAGVSSKGRCAMYVRQAIEAGGLSTAGRPSSAYQYTGFLPKIGFKHVAALNGVAKQAEWTNSSAVPGDIAVMSHGPHGHICMWTGTKWISDFIQNKMWPYSGDGLCNIFRFA